MTESTIFHPVMLLMVSAIPFLFVLLVLRSKHTGYSVLYRLCELVSNILIGLACGIMAACVGLESAWAAFRETSRAVYWHRWSHIMGLPAQSAPGSVKMVKFG